MVERTKVDYDDGSHKRFHIFRHRTEMVNGAPVQIIEDAQDSDEIQFAHNFAGAKLYVDVAAAMNQAKSYAEQGSGDMFTYCVGRVDVTVDGFFEIKVMKESGNA